jgi:hypothetical protein
LEARKIGGCKASRPITESMGEQQTWIVTATPMERWTLSLFLFNTKLEFSGRQEQKRLYRARKALGLLEPSDAFMTYNGKDGPLRVGPAAEDRKTRHRFAVTVDNAEFILNALEKTPMRGGDTMRLEGLLQQLEAKEDADDAETAAEYSPELDAPEWKPSLKPMIDQPSRLLDILDHAFGAESYGEARRRYREASAPDPESKAA